MMIQIVCQTSAWESDFEGGLLNGSGWGGVVGPLMFLSFRWLLYSFYFSFLNWRLQQTSPSDGLSRGASWHKAITCYS